jgi:hypothetical protein
MGCGPSNCCCLGVCGTLFPLTADSSPHKVMSHRIMLYGPIVWFRPEASKTTMPTLIIIWCFSLETRQFAVLQLSCFPCQVYGFDLLHVSYHGQSWELLYLITFTFGMMLRWLTLPFTKTKTLQKYSIFSTKTKPFIFESFLKEPYFL